MLPPQKPWEAGNFNQRVPASIFNSDGLQSSTGIVGPSAGGAHPRLQSRNPPPLPPRHTRPSFQSGLGLNGSNYHNSPFTSYGGFGTGFNNYSSYGGYGGYGSYGGYGNYNSIGSYGRYGGYGPNTWGSPHAMPESRFIQMAEDGTRPAFHSIESLVHAFGSVTFMLESTFNAMYSSFRAVLGVAENFGRLRALFGQFLSVFAVFRWLQWLYKKCLYHLGLRSEDPGREQLWRQASQGVVGGSIDSEGQRTSWPIMVFLGIILSGPYLMWKLLSTIEIPNIDPSNPKDWAKCQEPANAALVLYDFNAASAQELNIQAGQKVVIAPRDCQQNQSWLLATVDGKKVGLVPANYLRVIGRAVQQKKPAPQFHSNAASGSEESEAVTNTSLITGSEEPTVPINNIPGPSTNAPVVETLIEESSNKAQSLE